MAILIDQKKKVLIQGITGREGRARTRLMLDYGTKVIGGVTPGHGGEEVFGLPVYDTVKEAVEAHGTIDVSVLFVPGPFVRDAAIEAIENGIKLLVIIPDRVPIHDTLTIVALARRKGASFIGPNTLGVISPHRAVLGMIGGRIETAREWFRPGDIGVISRSGGMTTSLSYYLTRAGLGQSTAVHIGGDAVVGETIPEIALRFEADPQTRLMVIFGEIGTTQEENLAQAIRAGKITKPIVAYIGGRGAKAGTRFSHAGAIIEGGRGGYESKVAALRSAGVHVAQTITELVETARRIHGMEVGNNQG
ncbi:succinate--CoA ligase subunit alpha [candidate division WOR-3 bacterium]|uniref:Succinate--CoA ligase subunit alpha n=1 Tax=candidate division WOR-3 bacterium TaxID=2052148 RepID=A0A660SE76_UNCW3|nr:MAG: succinate--CoA ligase subunit alpha [candidate division WOR-3 bacterium]